MPNSQSQSQFQVQQRNLTDADIEAILAAAEKRFYLNLGKGLWDMVWKTILIILVGVAAWGAYHK